jgi:glycine/D-amino acid oxidase-like deaminating enzyme
MSSDYISHDAVIVGGGFYGTVIATYLIKRRGFKRVTLVEREAGLLQRASFKNQARVHNGYHYPRSFLTAYRSRVNFPNFVRDWPDAIVQDFDKIYAVANRNSKLTAKQFERFCNDIGAKIKIAPNSLRSLFSPYLIDNVFLVEEYAFDSTKLANWAEKELEDCGVRIYLKTNALGISRHSNKNLKVLLSQEGKSEESFITKYVFNCAYSGINQFQGDFGGIKTNIKHEITEMALVQPPPILKDLGITVMDGPFFSLMPFPARELHTLSHVRYTPHFQWIDKPGIDPYKKLDMYQSSTRVDRMMRDVERYMPSISKAKYIDSLFEIKTVLVKNEVDDGRPILFEKSLGLPGCYSILGGKIDNIYDVLEKLDAEQFLI